MTWFAVGLNAWRRVERPPLSKEHQEAVTERGSVCSEHYNCTLSLVYCESFVYSIGEMNIFALSFAKPGSVESIHHRVYHSLRS